MLVLHNDDLTQVSWEMRTEGANPVWSTSQDVESVDYAGWAQLRHFAISYWLLRGVDVKTAAEWSRHKNPTVLLSTYAHVLGIDAKRAALALLDTPAVPALSWGAVPKSLKGLD